MVCGLRHRYLLKCTDHNARLNFIVCFRPIFTYPLITLINTRMIQNKVNTAFDTPLGEVISKNSTELTDCTGCLASKLIIEMSIERAGEARARVSNVFIPDCQVRSSLMIYVILESSTLFRKLPKVCMQVDTGYGHRFRFLIAPGFKSFHSF